MSGVWLPLTDFNLIGISKFQVEKARLTAEYFKASFHFFRKSKEDCEKIILNCPLQGHYKIFLSDISELLKNVLVFAMICGLLFNDPFGIINTISNVISGVGETGLAGFISLDILI